MNHIVLSCVLCLFRMLLALASKISLKKDITEDRFQFLLLFSNLVRPTHGIFFNGKASSGKCLLRILQYYELFCFHPLPVKMLSLYPTYIYFLGCWELPTMLAWRYHLSFHTRLQHTNTPILLFLPKAVGCYHPCLCASIN